MVSLTHVISRYLTLTHIDDEEFDIRAFRQDLFSLFILVVNVSYFIVGPYLMESLAPTHMEEVLTDLSDNIWKKEEAARRSVRFRQIVALE